MADEAHGIVAEATGTHGAAPHAAGGHGHGNPLQEDHGSFVQPFAKGLSHLLSSLCGQEVVIPNWLFMSWLIIAFLAIFAWRATRQMGLTPRGIQNLAELIVEALCSFTKSIIGENGHKYAPFVGTLFLYIFMMNIQGLIPGMVAPTAKLSTTLALGILTFVFVQFYAIRDTSFGAYIKHLCGEPVWLAPLMFPLHVIGELAKPLSLAIRLFGNIFGKDMVIINLVLLAAAFPWFLRWLPIQTPLLAFGLFVGFVQALVFATLAAVYISLFMSHEGDEHEH